MAAPTATTSSGLTPLCGSLPKISLTICWTRGIRVEPPTSTTSSICEALSLASSRAFTTGARHRSKSASVSFSNWLRSNRHRQVLWSVLIGRDEGQVDVSLGLERQVLLGFFGRFLQSLQGHLVLAEINPLLSLELVGDVVHRVPRPNRRRQGEYRRWSRAPRKHRQRRRGSRCRTCRHRGRKQRSSHSSSCRARMRAHAAVGSLMIRATSKPAIWPASLVAWRWLSLK